jgi:hypothetical protein
MQATFCSTQNIWWDFSLARVEGDKYLLFDTGFEIYHVCFVSPHHFHQMLRHYSRAETLRIVSNAIVLLAGRCPIGHKNANRMHAHGSACTLVAATQDVA